MTERNPAVVVILSLVTLSLYAFYWLYKTTEELKQLTGDDRLDPMVDLVLAVVTFGIWGLYAGWRNARIAHEELVARGESHQSKSDIVLACNIGSFFVGMSWLVSVAVLQEDYNALARTAPFVAGVDSAPMPAVF